MSDFFKLGKQVQDSGDLSGIGATRRMLLIGKFINHRRCRRFWLAAERVMLLVVDSLKPGHL